MEIHPKGFWMSPLPIRWQSAHRITTLQKEESRCRGAREFALSLRRKTGQEHTPVLLQLRTTPPVDRLWPLDSQTRAMTSAGRLWESSGNGCTAEWVWVGCAVGSDCKTIALASVACYFLKWGIQVAWELQLLHSLYMWQGLGKRPYLRLSASLRGVKSCRLTLCLAIFPT